jgi:hypothetical protein
MASSPASVCSVQSYNKIPFVEDGGYSGRLPSSGVCAAWDLGSYVHTLSSASSNRSDSKNSNLGICWAARQTNFELKSRPYLHRIESRRQRSTRPSATTSTPSRLLERDLTGSRQSCSTQLVLQKPVSTIPSVLRSPPTHRPTQMVAGLLRQLGASAARQGRECRGGIRGFSQCCRRGQSEVEVPHTTGLDRWLALSSE